MKIIATAVLTLCACSNQDIAEKKKVGVTFDDVKRDTGKAVDSAGKALDTTAAYVSQSKDEYLAALQAKLTQVNADITQGKKDLGRLNGKAKSDAEIAMTTLEAKRDELKKEIENVKNGTADHRQEAKAKVQTTLDALDAAVQTFKDKMK